MSWPGAPDGGGELLAAMAAYAGEAGLLSEQVWDADDIPEKGLFRGRPTGSALPLLWAHSEYLKLLRSLKDGRVFDRPPQAAARYVTGGQEHTLHAVWRTDHPLGPSERRSGWRRPRARTSGGRSSASAGRLPSLPRRRFSASG